MANPLHKSFNSAPAETDRRVRLVTLVLFLFGIILVGRLFSLQVVQHKFYAAAAIEKHEVYRNLFPERGSIYVRENDQLYPLVTNREYFLVYAEPNKIESPNKVIDVITPILGLEQSEWKNLLSKIADSSDPYEPIKRRVTQVQVDQIKEADLSGIGFLSENYRYYPEKNIGGHMFGFLGIKDDQRVGQYGLEGYFNEELAGKNGTVKSVRDALGALVTIGPRSIKPATDGDDLVLTIDRRIQFTVCEKLKEFYEYFEAEKGSVLIMDPKTGAIISMCSVPDFDPEFYNETEDINNFNNATIFYDFEPGSIFKPITMAAALDAGKLDPETTFIDEGEIKIGPFTVRNADLQAHGEQTMTEVLEKSLNTGAIFVADAVGKRKFRSYVKDFGFGEKTNIELETEVAGNISSLDKKGDIYYLTGSYGQGLTATSLQLVSAFGAIANNGKLMKPYLVSEIIKPDGEVIKTKPESVRQVIKPKTATLLSGMLASVIENGFGAKAGVEGYYLGGKTGTAQIASPDGGYGAENIHSFIGFGPINDPKFVMLVKLDKPKGIRFASDSVAPMFGQLAEFLLSYYQIPPNF